MTQKWEMRSLVDGRQLWAFFVGDANHEPNGNILVDNGGITDPAGVSSLITEVEPTGDEGGTIVFSLASTTTGRRRLPGPSGSDSVRRRIASPRGRRTRTIFHNPQCSTSTKVVGMAEDFGADADLVLYLKEHPTRDARMAGGAPQGSPPADLVRKDSFFESLGLDADDYTKPKAIVDLLLEHPRLMQRPLLVKGDRVVIGRPVDRASELLES